MQRLNPKKLSVEYGSGVSPVEPILGRKYTLNHPVQTAELFLSIGLKYTNVLLNDKRDEVRGEWRTYKGEPYLLVMVEVDGQLGAVETAIRNAIFRRELPLALEAIRYGDGKFFAEHPSLDNAPVWIQFESTDPHYSRLENWGTPKDCK